MPVPNAMPAADKIGALASEIKKIDVWIQDKCVPLFWVGAGLLITSTGLLLLWKWIQVISLAEQLAPVLTVLSGSIVNVVACHRDLSTGLLSWMGGAIAETFPPA